MTKQELISSINKFHLPKPQEELVAKVFFGITKDHKSALYLSQQVIKIGQLTKPGGKKKNMEETKYYREEIERYVECLDSFLVEHDRSWEDLATSKVLQWWSINDYVQL